VTHDVDEAVYLATDVVVMDEATKSIRTSMEVELPWPREPAVRLEKDFVELKASLWSELHRKPA
jgi:NitT/TauT family transport system ATP-binding protein